MNIVLLKLLKMYIYPKYSNLDSLISYSFLHKYYHYFPVYLSIQLIIIMEKE